MTCSLHPQLQGSCTGVSKSRARVHGSLWLLRFPAHMRSPIIAAILLVLAAPSAATAQRDDQFVFGISGGPTFTAGNAHDQHSTGAHGMLSWGIGMVDSPWGIRFDGTYSSLGDRESSTTVDQGSAKLFILGGNAVFNIYGSNTHLYGIAGLGGYWYNPDGAGTSTKNDLALQAGLGTYLGVGHLFVEAKFVNLYRALPDQNGVKGKRSARLIPVTLGILF